MRAKLRILNYLAKVPYWNTGLHIARMCDVSRFTVYFHLSMLEDAGLVESRPGRNAITFAPMRQRPVFRSRLVERQS